LTSHILHEFTKELFMTRPIPSARGPTRLRLIRVLAALAIATAGVTPLCAAENTNVTNENKVGPRFSASGAVMPLNRSMDGRFAGGGDANYTPTTSSSAGRFSIETISSAGIGCDRIFRDGFES
jgi:hypothetical protein